MAKKFAVPLRAKQKKNCYKFNRDGETLEAGWILIFLIGLQVTSLASGLGHKFPSTWFSVFGAQKVNSFSTTHKRSMSEYLPLAERNRAHEERKTISLVCFPDKKVSCKTILGGLAFTCTRTYVYALVRHFSMTRKLDTYSGLTLRTDVVT